jgi:hypothetical protein
MLEAGRDGRRELVCRGETDCDGRKELEVGTICRCTYSGRPPGTAEFIGELKQKTRRALEFWKAARIEGVLVELCLHTR